MLPQRKKDMAKKALGRLCRAKSGWVGGWGGERGVEEFGRRGGTGVLLKVNLVVVGQSCCVCIFDQVVCKQKFIPNRVLSL